jgi:hypothetical protein
MQGKSIVPLLKGSTPSTWRDAIYYQYFEYPGWHAVRRQYGVRTRLAELRKEFKEPASDPAPYYPWELPPDYRRPGMPGTDRNAEHIH